MKLIENLLKEAPAMMLEQNVSDPHIIKSKYLTKFKNGEVQFGVYKKDIVGIVNKENLKGIQSVECGLCINLEESKKEKIVLFVEPQYQQSDNTIVKLICKKVFIHESL